METRSVWGPGRPKRPMQGGRGRICCLCAVCGMGCLCSASRMHAMRDLCRVCRISCLCAICGMSCLCDMRRVPHARHARASGLLPMRFAE